MAEPQTLQTWTDAPVSCPSLQACRQQSKLLCMGKSCTEMLIMLRHCYNPCKSPVAWASKKLEKLENSATTDSKLLCCKLICCC